ncbi:MAG: trigger factor [Candidatus Latescibacterota bacterium]|nr:MAG: trigger factor [Candidatus Latescibacterota bacterium]
MAKEFTDKTRKERKFTVSVESPSGCKRVLSLDIPKEEVEKEESRVRDALRRDLKVPGFRKGKVPLKYIEKNYGGAVHADAVQNLLPAVYEDALNREGIRPIAEPRFENLKAERGENISVEVVVEVRPEVVVEGYQDVKVKVQKNEIGEKEISEVLERLREQNATLAVVDRASKEDDFLLIDYAPLLDSGNIDGTKLSENYPVDLTGGSLLPEFREGLIGLSVKDEKDIEVEYPDDFPEKNVAGTKKKFRVTVKEVKEKRLPEINDEFAKSLGKEFTGLAALKEKVGEDLVAEEAKRRDHDVEEMIIDQLIEKNPFDVPDAMVENYLASVLEEDRQRRPNAPDEAEREKEIREHFTQAAVRTIKKFLILEAVRKQESLDVSREDIEAKIGELTAGGEERSDEIKEYFRHPERRRSLENEMRDRKVLDFLREKADITVGK